MAQTGMRILSRNDIEMVHDTSLRILAEVGIRVESPSVLALLERVGADIDEEHALARLDESIVSQALDSAPKSVGICSRAGVDHWIPEDDLQLVSPDGQPPAVFDLSTGVKRPSTLKDVIEFAVLSDALPEVGYIWPPVVATDMPAERTSFYEFIATLAYTSKHIQHGATSAQEANFQIEVASAVLGSLDALRERPIFSDVITPISPLRYDRGEAEALVVLARAGVPVVNLSMGIAGAVTPITVAGTLAVVNAENLAGLTMTQASNPGAPSIYSSFSGPSDLKTGVFLCGSPENLLMDGAAVEMAQSYGLPTCAGGPATVSRTPCFEAGAQSSLSLVAGALSGADLLVGLGGLERDGMVSMEKLVADCEVWRWVKRLRKGVRVDEDTLGFDAVKRQGPAGIFLSDPHTLKHMRSDLMVPQVTSYRSPEGQGTATDDLLEHAKRRVKEILASHKPPLLDGETARKVGDVAKKYGVVTRDSKQIFEHA